MFTWRNETETSRRRTKVEAVQFPSSVGPKTHIKVLTVVHKGIIQMPFTARLTSGNRKWFKTNIFTFFLNFLYLGMLMALTMEKTGPTSSLSLKKQVYWRGQERFQEYRIRFWS